MTNYILIDGSYYCFYRYYSLIRWWNNAHKDESLGVPSNNDIFINKFKKMYVENINKLSRKLNINKDEEIKIIIAKDCPRQDIWRKKIYNEYKSNRDDNYSDISYFFRLAYEELIYDELINYKINILSHPQLEADDCIAIYTKQLLNVDLNNKIYIIASDNDYLQLVYDDNLCEHIKIYDLSFKNLKEQNSNKNCNLFCKILIGDKSDNIKSIMPKCGVKTAQKYDNNRELFNQLLENNENIREKYEFNRLLMDFNLIPENLINEFISMNNLL
jgi:5'-3' exonuclease